MNRKPPRASAAGIVITEDMLVRPPKRSTATDSSVRAADSETAEIFGRLRALKRGFGLRPNKDELAQALIGACVVEGLDTRPRIVGALRCLGLKPAHVVALLNRYAGDDSARHFWRADGDGNYRILDRA